MRTTTRRLQALASNPFIPFLPTVPQARFILSPRSEVLYGGAAGGGKSVALLMAALENTQHPKYAGLLLRRTLPELKLSGGLMDLAGEWLGGSRAKWNDDSKTWSFPSGATLTFGYLEAEKDRYRYQGAAFNFIGFDELTQFMETQYRYLFSRRRREAGSDLPSLVRATSNPGGVGHDWVRSRFMDTPDQSREFIPARLSDNPHLDQEDYILSLMELDPITRQQLLEGDWTARQPGGKFKREWFKVVDKAPEGKKVRYWDLAATEAKPGKDPDWTAGCLMSRSDDGQYYIEDIRHVRAAPRAVEQLVAHTAEVDGIEAAVWMEQEPGASGVAAIDHYRRQVIPSYDFHADKVTGNKELRANPLSSQAEAGNVLLVRGDWNQMFLDEAESFPMGSHDDAVDSAAGAFTKLHEEGGWVLAV